MKTIYSDEYELIITAMEVRSTEPNFVLKNFVTTKTYVLSDIYYKKDNMEPIRRDNLQYHEGQLSKRTLPRLGFQIFEEEISELDDTHRLNFPTYMSSLGKITEKGIFTSMKEMNTVRKSRGRNTDVSDTGYIDYKCKKDGTYYIYGVNSFYSIAFLQECLSRFAPNDEFVVRYKVKQTVFDPDDDDSVKHNDQNGDQETDFEYDETSYLKKSKNIILHGAPGTGKTFLAKEIAAEIVTNGISKHYKELGAEIQMEQIGFVQFHPSYDYSDFVEGLRPIIRDGMVGFELREGVFKSFVKKAIANFENKKGNARKSYVFIIDEINRGEIAKIFGELFFAISPDVRGPQGTVHTQYANMHAENDRFYIPDNLYIIGTMNDIDRSADSLDFAMRRRFRFIFMKAESGMLRDQLDPSIRDEAVKRMDTLNQEIQDKFGEAYCVGPAYFLKLNSCNYAELWSDHLEPLLMDYIHVMGEDEGLIKIFENAYNLSE